MVAKLCPNCHIDFYDDVPFTRDCAGCDEEREVIQQEAKRIMWAELDAMHRVERIYREPLQPVHLSDEPPF